MITTFTIPCLSLRQIAQSGQCFRMTPLPEHKLPVDADSGYRIISRGLWLNIWQINEQLVLDCPKENLYFWLSYFDYETDYQAVLSSVSPEDSYLQAAAQAGCGIRILRQDPWEMIITFVISQQKTIPNIRDLVEALSSSYGTPLTSSPSEEPARQPVLYSFPTPEQLAAATLEELQSLKLGYRSKYIYQLAQDTAAGILNLSALKEMPYKEAMSYLTSFYGIGKKVANCVCLFGLHHIDAFPVDTWIEKILMEQYYTKRRYGRMPKARLYDQIIHDHFGQYKGCAGIMQQYIFHFERNIRSRNDESHAGRESGQNKQK